MWGYRSKTKKGEECVPECDCHLLSAWGGKSPLWKKQETKNQEREAKRTARTQQRDTGSGMIEREGVWVGDG